MLQGTGFHLLIFAGKTTGNNIKNVSPHFDEKFRNFITSYEISYSAEIAYVYEIFGIEKQGYYLIRPDNYIALRYNSLQFPYLSKYLEKIF